MSIKFDFKVKIAIYFIAGLTINNLIQGIWFVVQRNAGQFGGGVDPYFFLSLIIVPVLIPFTYLSLVKLQNRKSQAIAILIIGIAFTAVSQTILNILGNVHLAMGIGFSLTAAGLVYFKRFHSFKKRLNETENIKDNLDRKIAALKFIHDETLFLLRQGLYIIFSLAVLFGSIVAILWSGGYIERSIAIFGSLYVVGMFLYSLFGLINWFLLPLFDNFKQIHKQLTSS